MPGDRAPTPPLNHTAVEIEESSDDRNSERSDSFATVEIVRSDGQLDSGATQTPSENTECEITNRHPDSRGDDVKNFTPTDIPEIPLERKKSSGISKGVILNAMNFGSYDIKCDPNEVKEKPAFKTHEMCENGLANPKAVEASSERKEKAPEEEEKTEEKKKMSLPRKIAFGFSFLPSVMFVLTFAVILPCEEYKVPGSCVKDRWSLNFNHTEIVSFLSLLPQTLLFGYQSENQSISSEGLVNLNGDTGRETWRIPLDSSPEYLDCESIDVNEDGIKDCFTVLQNGKIGAFNLSDGYLFWTFSTNQPKIATILLSGCVYKNLGSIAAASYNEGNTLVIDVLSVTDGSVLLSKEVRLVSKCISSRFNMQSWNHDNEMDLVYHCVDEHGIEGIWRVKQSSWCPTEEEGEGSAIIPQAVTKSHANATDSVYLATTEGLLVWTSTNVTVRESDGTMKWKHRTDYSPESKIVKFGRFYIGGEQFALISKNGSYYEDGVVVSIFTSDGGEELATLTFPYRTVTQAVIVKGNESDALLISAIKETETKQNSDNEVILRSKVNSSENFRKDAVQYDVTQNKVVQDLLLLEFEGKNKTHIILQNDVPSSCWSGDFRGSCKSEYEASSILSAFSEEEDNSMILKIIMLRTTGEKLSQGELQSSQLTALDITYESTPGDGEPACTL